MISDSQLLAAYHAIKTDRIQGFRYGDEYVVRDVYLPYDRQVLWRGTDSTQFHDQCSIERMRLVWTALTQS